MDFANTCFDEPLARQQKKVCQPFVRLARMLDECLGRVWVVLDECSAYLLPHLKMAGSNRRAEPGHKIGPFRSDVRKRLLDYSSSQTPPACVNSARHGSRAVAEEYREAVRG